MTKIGKVGLEPKESILDTERRRMERAPSAADDSVVTRVKPDVDDPGEALKVAVNIFANAMRAPAQAAAAQGDLDEERVKALLSED